MPELPEVETTRLGISPHIVGSKVTDLRVRNASLRWPVPDELGELIMDRKLLHVSRRGKYLILAFSNGSLLWHLGMSGSLRIVEAGTPPTTHDHVDVTFGKKTTLRFHDPRRFGSVLWAINPAEHKLLKNLGPEPLADDFSGDYLYARSRKRSQSIKTFIMDSKIVVGVGNIYANEALFNAKIHPLKAAGKLSKVRSELLVKEIKNILAKAIAQGGTTLRDFVNSDGKPGYFAQQLNVYGRGGLICHGCGKILIEKKLGQRSTVYCAHCQS